MRAPSAGRRIVSAAQVLLILLLAAIPTVSPATAAGAARPLWGHLVPGPYAIGFRSLYSFDKSREWRATRRYGQPFKPDREGRPVRVDLWYPAAPTPASKPMTYGDYVRSSGPRAFADYDVQVHGRDALLAELSVAEDNKVELRRLYDTPVPARRNARPVRARFPLVFWIGGQNDDLQSGALLAEYLASRGYIVAAVSLQGRDEGETTLRRRPYDTETTVRDIEFAWSRLRDDPRVDVTKMGVIGYSLGGVEELLFADRNPDVSAAVGLEGTYGFQGAADLLTGFYNYDPDRMRAAVLDLRRDVPAAGATFDLSALAAMHYADRYHVSLVRMHHSDFTTFAMLAPRYGISNTITPEDAAAGWNRETGAEGFQAMCPIIAAFLDLQLKHLPDARQKLEQAVAAAPGGRLAHDAAASTPPLPTDYIRLIRERGFDATLALVNRMRAAAPGGVTVIDWALLNNLGYDLLAQKRFVDAVGILRLNAEAFPTYADAADGLGDGYRVAGDKVHARQAYEQGIVRVATDDRYKSADDKKGFVQGEQQKIRDLSRGS